MLIGIPQVFAPNRAPPSQPNTTAAVSTPVAEKRLNATRMKMTINDNILGEVFGWGRYVRGGIGWRSQFAYPKSFYLKSSQVNLIDHLRPYHVPIYVEQPVLIYNPEEDGYEHGTHEAHRNLGAIKDAFAGEEDSAGDEADS